MKEIWKIIPGYSPYFASNLGRIKRNNIILKGNIQNNGYNYISISVNGEIRNIRTHRLIAYTFLKTRKKDGINHKDGNKLNNRIDNLEWATCKQNMRHAKKLGLLKGPQGEKQHMSKLTDMKVINIRKLYNTGEFTQNNLAKKYKVHQTNIHYIVSRKKWRHI